MPDDELEDRELDDQGGDEQADPPDDTRPEGDQYERQEDGSVVFEDGYRITADGRHFDAEGNELDEPRAEEDDGREERQPRTEQRQDERTQQQRQAQVYTPDNIFTPEEVEQLAELDVSDPGRAQYIRSQKFRQLENYCEDAFDRTVDELEQQAPVLAELYSRQIMRARRQMTHEQKQQPNAALQVAGLIMSEEITRLGLADDVADLIKEARRGRAGGGRQAETRDNRRSDTRARDEGGRFAPDPPQRRTLRPNERPPVFSTQRRDGSRGDRTRNPIAETVRKSVPYSDKAMKELLGE